ncbi:hypothetical protein ACVWZM_004291 [Bradyrhizobium sp. USDA 4501]
MTPLRPNVCLATASRARQLASYEAAARDPARSCATVRVSGRSGTKPLTSSIRVVPGKRSATRDP